MKAESLKKDSSGDVSIKFIHLSDKKCTDESVNVLGRIISKKVYDKKTIGKLENGTGIIDYKVHNDEAMNKGDTVLIKNTFISKELDRHFVHINKYTDIVKDPMDRYPGMRDPKGSFNSPLNSLKEIDVGDANFHLIGDIIELKRCSYENGILYKGRLRDDTSWIDFCMWDDFPERLGLSLRDRIELKGGFILEFDGVEVLQINPYDYVGKKV